jgi:hypothetical protein
MAGETAGLLMAIRRIQNILAKSCISIIVKAQIPIDNAQRWSESTTENIHLTPIATLMSEANADISMWIPIKQEKGRMGWKF